MKKKYWFILVISLIIIGILIFFLFFNKKTAKNLKMGHNTNSQDIVDIILNISSYETVVEVEVNSNKNSNKYKLKQQYEGENMSIQEVLEPSNIEGIKITKKGNQLKLENTKLQLSSIIENYEYLSDNCLDLSSFIKEYKEDSNANWKEENDKVKMKCTANGKEKQLEVDKTSGKPTKMEIRDINKKTSIYILYTEVNLS